MMLLDSGDFANQRNSLIASEERSRASTETRRGNLYYELHDKNKAAELLIKILMEEERKCSRPKTPVSCNGELLRIGFMDEE